MIHIYDLFISWNKNNTDKNKKNYDHDHNTKSIVMML